MNKKDRVGWIDQVRVFAAIAVIALHVNAQIIAVSGAPYSSTFEIANAFDSALRWCVPVFVMISGHLLLNQTDHLQIGAEIRHLMRRISVPFVFWTVVFLFWATYHGQPNGHPIDAHGALKSLIRGRPYFHLWYLYMLIGLYFITPVLRRALSSMSDKDKVHLTVLAILYGMIEKIFMTATWADNDFFTWFLPYIGYFLAGHLIGARTYKVSRIALILGWTLAWTSTFLGYFFSTLYLPERRDYFYDYLSITVVPMSIFVFMWFQKYSFVGRCRNWIEAMGPYAFGLYLIHPIWLGVIYTLNLGPSSSRPIVWIFVTTFAVFVLSLGSVAIIKQIPFLRRVV